MSHSTLIERLNMQLNREVATFLRYMLEAAQIRGTEWEPVRAMYLEELKDEVDHAQYLANQISLLGAIPVLEPDLAPPPERVEQMLIRDAGEERTDVRNYIQLAALADEEGLIALKVRMEEQAADEDEHGQDMLRLAGSACSVPTA
jgi:bacterioferritin